MQLNQAVYQRFVDKGCDNNLRAQFYTEVARNVVGSSVLFPIQPKVKNMDSKAWNKSLCFVVSYLRRFKMEKSIQAMKIEYSSIPRNTGFSKVSELDQFFRQLKNMAIKIDDQSFEERVIDLREEMGN